MNRPPAPSPSAPAAPRPSTTSTVRPRAGRASTRRPGSRCSPGSCSRSASWWRCSLVPGLPDVAPRPPLRGGCWSPAFALAETLVVHLELRNEAHTFTLVEVPLLLGLFFASPGDLILGRLLGEGLILALRVRQARTSTPSTWPLFLAETSIALAVFGLIDQRPGHHQPAGRGWPASPPSRRPTSSGTATVSTVIAWHGGDRNTAQLLLGGGHHAGHQRQPGPQRGPAPVGELAGGRAGRGRHRRLLPRLPGLRWRCASATNTHLPVRRSPASSTTPATPRPCSTPCSCRPASCCGPSGPRSRCSPPDDEPLRRATQPGAPAPPWSAPPTPCPAEVADAADRARAWCGRPAAPATPGWPPSSRDLGAPDAMLTPLVADGRLVGVMTVADRTSDVSTFDDDDAQAFATLADHASVALENGRLLERLDDEARQRAHDALHDALTGLANRRLHRSGSPAALDGPGAADRRRAASPGPRPLQRGQRHARATPPATSCCSRSPPGFGAGSAPRRRPRPPRRRRVRRAAPGPRDRRALGRGGRRRPPAQPGRAVRRRTACSCSHRRRRHRPRAPSTATAPHAAAAGRRRHVQRQGAAGARADRLRRRPRRQQPAPPGPGPRPAPGHRPGRHHRGLPAQGPPVRRRGRSASRPWPAGPTPSTASFPPTSSSPWPSAPGSSRTSRSPCCAVRSSSSACGRELGYDLSMAVNVSTRVLLDAEFPARRSSRRCC